VTTERTLDPIDLQILDQLQANARETQADIARAVGLAPSAVLERVRKLEARGVIKGYNAQVNPRSLGLGLLAFVAVRSDGTSVDQGIARALSGCEEVLEVHHVAGDDCYLIKVRARDAEHLGQLLRTRFSRIPGVRSTRTTVVLETMKETSRLPVQLPVRGEGVPS
jgi:Lrp/AsnC family leucine-responsive transcriptional regulator